MEITKLPLFTIITITFNNRDGLQRTATSIKTQTHTDYEWVIIDGASTDGTNLDFINYPSAYIISETDKGIYDAMNKGITHSTGDYIIFMNAGDVFADAYVLEKIATETRAAPDFIYGDSIEDGHMKRARHHSKIIWGMFTHHQAMFYRRESLGRLRYDLNYKIAADYDLTIAFLKKAHLAKYIPIPICIFETGGTSQINAKCGRDEQFESRRKNKSCSMILNILIKSAQALVWFIRTKNKNAYWLIKK